MCVNMRGNIDAVLQQRQTLIAIDFNYVRPLSSSQVSCRSVVVARVFS